MRHFCRWPRRRFIIGQSLPCGVGEGHRMRHWPHRRDEMTMLLQARNQEVSVGHKEMVQSSKKTHLSGQQVRVGDRKLGATGAGRKEKDMMARRPQNPTGRRAYGRDYGGGEPLKSEPLRRDERSGRGWGRAIVS
jgi:hypothetical protein